MLQYLLHEENILTDLRSRDISSAVLEISDRVCAGLSRGKTDQPLPFSMIEEGVGLVEFFRSSEENPKLYLGVQKEGMGNPSCSLLFLLVLPEGSQSLSSQIQDCIRRIIKERFVRERIKISDYPEDVLEVLMRESRESRHAILSA